MKAPSAFLTALALNVLVGSTFAAPVPDKFYNKYNNYGHSTDNKFLAASAAVTGGAGVFAGVLMGRQGLRETERRLATTQAELDQANAEIALHTKIANQPRKSEIELYEDVVHCWTNELDEAVKVRGDDVESWFPEVSRDSWGKCMDQHKVSHFSPFYHFAPPALDVKAVARRVQESKARQQSQAAGAGPHDQSMMAFARAPAAIQHNLARLSKGVGKEFHSLMRGVAAFHPSRVGPATAAAERRLAAEGI
ncbi:MAG: hypothetical protein M1826_005416 [Phylliscum demangeonii]|nr:MAG: hypothetical protein M1826_005416 [Phylliscum demangeonii]